MQINGNKAGIYIHIPFCKQACTYCNFHFSTSLQLKAEMIDALLEEIGQRKDYVENKEIQSIYFGGGTPSLLSPEEINKILEIIKSHFIISEDVEITIECNPDDIGLQKLMDYKAIGLNRISLGIQSFRDADLMLMNRSHDVAQAENSLTIIKQAGFNNISADLIYGIPGLSNADWELNIQKLIDSQVEHISAYALTVEPKTVLQHQITKKKVKAPDDNQAAEQFDILVDVLNNNGFEHYEISNFAKQQKYSRHNTSYWLGNFYLGLGPSAHSFNGISRQWNIANNSKYIESIKNRIPDFEFEKLSESQQINECIMIALRTMWGLNIKAFSERFGKEHEQILILSAESYIKLGLIKREGDFLIISPQGKFISDAIISDLFTE